MDLREMPVRGDRQRPDQLEVRHPWEQSRARFFRRVLLPHLRSSGRLLDIGAGDGYLVAPMLPALQPGGQIVCFDSCYSDEHLARLSATARPGLSFTRKRPASRFDVILLLDVLEHMSDDGDSLAGIVRDLLAPGGMLLASVPAYPWLFTRHDASLGHCRRYRPDDLRRLLTGAGLVIQASAGLFHCLLPVRAAQKMGELLRGVRTRPMADVTPEHAETGLTDWNGSRWLSGAMVGMLSLDNWISVMCARTGVALPGLSVWALARKP